MASAAPANDFQRAAQCLSVAYDRTLPESIFNEAIKDARAEASQKQDQALLQYISSIHDEPSLRASIERVTQPKNGGPTSRLFSRKIARLCGRLERPMVVACMIAEANSLAKPVVGALAYIMTIVQEITDMDDLLEDFLSQTERSLQAFKLYFMRHTPSDPLLSALKKFYRAILDFGVFLGNICFNSIGKLSLRLASSNVKQQLQSVVQNLEKCADWVFKVASGEAFSRGIAIENALSEPPVVPPTPGRSSPRLVYVSMKLSTHFTGREPKLRDMSRILGPFNAQQPSQVALWGIPGVGKTQLSLRYRQWATTEPTAASYDHLVFVRANDTATIGAEFRRVATELGLVKDALVEQKSESSIAELVKRWFRSHDRWLLIFDNVSKVNDLLRFHPTDGTGHIIYTTRSQATAELLCKADNTLQVLGLTDQLGAAFVKASMGPASLPSVDAEAVALEVVRFAKGLPLSIEQIVNSAKFQGIPLRQALENAKNKRDFLQQKALDSFHGDNLSTGAILMTSYDAVVKKYPMAAVLFQVLVYLEPSAIPLAMLLEGASEMDDYLARQTTFSRGAIRTVQGDAHYQQNTRPKRFSLYDYDPFEPQDLQRLIRRVKGKAAHDPSSGLPRVDSSHDIEMQQFWQSSPTFRGLFTDKSQMERSLNQLCDTGLVKRLDTQTLWIHDLFAELMVVHTAAMEDQGSARAKIHATATMVCLAIPIPQGVRWGLEHKCMEFLPHARRCLQALEENALLTESTIGSELSHVAGSALALQASRADDFRIDRCDNAVWREHWHGALRHYNNAFKGYVAAQRGLMAAIKGGTDEKQERIRRRTMFEMQIEDECQMLGRPWRYYTCSRWLYEYERFGSNATWRTFQLCGKLGHMYSQLKDWDTAELWSRRAKVGAESIWGIGVHQAEVRIVNLQLSEILLAKQDWQGALDLAMQQRHLFQIWCDIPGNSAALEQDSALAIPTTIATCHTQLQNTKQAVYWWGIALVERRQVHGEYAIRCMPVEKELAKALAADGAWHRSLQLWLHCVGFAIQCWNSDARRDGLVYLHAEAIDDIAHHLALVKRAVAESDGSIDHDLHLKIETAENHLATVKLNIAFSDEIQDLVGAVWDDELSDHDKRSFQTMSLQADREGLTKEWLGIGFEKNKWIGGEVDLRED